MQQQSNTIQDNGFLGAWATRDGYIRQEFLADGRYAEARGENEETHTGRYMVCGNRIRYWDDSGFTTTGDFNRNLLYLGGYIFYRQTKETLAGLELMAI